MSTAETSSGVAQEDVEVLDDNHAPIGTRDNHAPSPGKGAATADGDEGYTTLDNHAPISPMDNHAPSPGKGAATADGDEGYTTLDNHAPSEGSR
ncbi:hypothetical protein [Streptomyces sp. TP-A0874]|uniref:hypothetical protein n=1 Tax=Streptomyces sp. TP-A0874 TaxID=549819 RepID=UPI000853DCDD|nr:hypothetical protein [Streptomyces sp. TP-A0874]